jgi:hypothetical protein
MKITGLLPNYALNNDLKLLNMPAAFYFSFLNTAKVMATEAVSLSVDMVIYLTHEQNEILHNANSRQKY